MEISEILLMYVKAFFVGGLICAFGQILIMKTQLTSARILVGYVTAGVILGALGLYKPVIDFAGAGATVPLTGFGYVLANGAIEGAKSNGLLGAFTGGVIAGAGGNCTKAVIEDALRAQQLGADAILSVTPYYVKCGDGGLMAHYTALADAVEIPVILYNVPSRTGVNLKPQVAAALAEHPHICGVKEAAGDYPQIAAMLEALRGKAAVYCGTDGLNQTMLAMGAQGVISVTANVAPKPVKRLVDAALGGDVAQAARMQAALEPLNEALFLEGNPIPVKAALAELGLIAGEYRLPLAPPKPETLERIRAALAGVEV